MIGAYIVIIIGIILLGINLGYLDETVWRLAWKFWPLLLILFGVSMLTRKALPKYTRIIIGLVILAAVILGAVYIERHGGLSTGALSSGKEEKTTTVDEPLSSSIKKVECDIELGAQNIKLDATSSGLITGQVSLRSAEPQIKVSQRGETALIKVEPSRRFTSWWPGARQAGETKLSLTNQAPLGLTLKLGATDIEADLTDLIVTKLDLKVGAFRGTLRYGARQTRNQTNINAGASDIKIYIPKSSGIKVDYANGLVGMKYTGLDMQKSGDSRQDKSANYDNAATKLDFDVKAGASSIEFVGY